MPLWTFNRKPQPAPQPQERPAAGFFSTHQGTPEQERRPNRMEMAGAAMRASLPKETTAGAQDDSSADFSLKLTSPPNCAVNPAIMDWYASQGFIGWQACAVLMQNWLIDKAITMPARDATRNGWDNVRVDGEELDDEHAKLLKKFDKKYRIKWHAEQFVRLGRAFGLRLALFKVESTDPNYYTNPFNPDGVTEGTYKGIAQIDPYWCAPLLEAAATGDPGNIHFYEPTYWIIGGRKVHRSHLCIFRSSEPPDILKPMYMYGGVPVTQLIMERVYAAERVANEAPLLAQSKRTTVWLTDLATMQLGGAQAQNAIQNWVNYRDNHGIKLGDKEADEFQQFETSLADLDSVVMTQYQLVAAAAGVPATKLLGTSPKGFNATGEYEEASYHEVLESIQEHDLTPLLERHHLLTLRSAGIKDVETTVSWRPLDAPTAAEVAETNLKKAQVDAALAQAGAIDGEDIRRRLATDPDSGYAQLGAATSELADLGLSDEGIEAAQAIGIG
jgi:phage-related protein (TIGR01555 family)